MSAETPPCRLVEYRMTLIETGGQTDDACIPGSAPLACAMRWPSSRREPCPTGDEVVGRYVVTCLPLGGAASDLDRGVPPAVRLDRTCDTLTPTE